MNEERKPLLSSGKAFALHLLLVGTIVLSFLLYGATYNVICAVVGTLALFAFELLHYYAGKNGL